MISRASSEPLLAEALKYIPERLQYPDPRTRRNNALSVIGTRCDWLGVGGAISNHSPGCKLVLASITYGGWPFIQRSVTSELPVGTRLFTNKGASGRIK